MQIVQEENELRAAGGRLEEAEAPPQPDSQPDPVGVSPTPQVAAQSSSNFDKLSPGRHCKLELPLGPPHSTKEHSTRAARFNAAMLDVSAEASRQAARDCAVFIVPQV